MNKLRATVFFLLFFFISLTCGKENRHQDATTEKKEEVAAPAVTPPSRLESLKTMFSPSTSHPAPTTSYWNKVKAMVNQGQAYIFPPNIEGRKEVEGGVGGGGGGEAGAGEKMKNAAVKSFGTVEDSAESVARAAGDAVHKTTETVKNTLSGNKRDDVKESEL